MEPCSDRHTLSTMRFVQTACAALLTLSCVAATAHQQQPTRDQLPGKTILAKVGNWLKLPPEQRASAIPQEQLTKEDAGAISQLIFETLKAEAQVSRQSEWTQTNANQSGSIKLSSVKAAGKVMKVLERTIGKAPKGGHSLWISMHGGGGTTAATNDQQWRNQISLYTPKEGIYVAPRAPSNTWNLWHESHIDALFDRLISNYVIKRGVNPDRVYLMGYSAGGDGVYQLAPRMADRFAAASMMAGHPNGVSMLSLRNLPFMIWMGAKDGAYKRNAIAAQWGKKLDKLAANDPGAYLHETHIIAGKGHWMDREDAAAVPWMAKHTRATWPKKVVWHQTGRPHQRFYWLSVAGDNAQLAQTITAEVNQQTVTVKSDSVTAVRVRLSDKLLDLDRDIIVKQNDEEVFRGTLPRTVLAIYESLQQRMDPSSVACATLQLGK